LSKAIREAEKKAREREMHRKPFEVRPFRALKPSEREREQYMDSLAFISGELIEALQTARRLNLKETIKSLEKASAEAMVAWSAAKREWIS